MSLSKNSVVDLMLASPIRELLMRPVFLSMIREDTLLESMRPYVESADLTEGESPLIEEWANQRTKEFPIWESWANKSLIGFEENTPANKDRKKLRMSAMRRLDIGITGTETLMQRPSSFGGDLYVAIHLESIQKTIKVGLPHSAKFGNDIRKTNLLAEAIINPENVEAVEDALFSLSSGASKNNPEKWAKIRANWNNALPLRLHEVSSITSYLPKGIYASAPVAGLVRRIDAETTQKLGQDTLQEFGLCAWWPKGTAMFLAANQHLLPDTEPEQLLKEWLLKLVSSRLTTSELATTQN